MALWQFDFSLIPKENRLDAIESSWQKYVHTNALIESLSSLLNQSQSWHSELKCWGEEESHRVEIWQEDDQICEILIRVDLRINYEKFLNAVLSIAYSYALLVVVEGNVFLEPTRLNLNTYMVNSDAMKFVTNPEDLLKQKSSEA